MSLSVRSQILNNIKEILTTINFGEKVTVKFCSPDDLDLKTEIPALTIEIIGEDSQYTTLGFPREKEKVLNIDICSIVKSRLDLFLKADEMITKVEEKLSESREIIKLNSLNDVVASAEVTSLEYRDYSELTENCGGFILSLTVNYYVTENNLRQEI